MPCVGTGPHPTSITIAPQTYGLQWLPIYFVIAYNVRYVNLTHLDMYAIVIETLAILLKTSRGLTRKVGGGRRVAPDVSIFSGIQGAEALKTTFDELFGRSNRCPRKDLDLILCVKICEARGEYGFSSRPLLPMYQFFQEFNGTYSMYQGAEAQGPFSVQPVQPPAGSGGLWSPFFLLGGPRCGGVSLYPSSLLIFSIKPGESRS